MHVVGLIHHEAKPIFEGGNRARSAHRVPSGGFQIRGDQVDERIEIGAALVAVPSWRKHEIGHGVNGGSQRALGLLAAGYHQRFVLDEIRQSQLVENQP